ncbi:hypothetical protein ACXR2U_09545 [Jatrophihabitans sp. YIM 134969]
MPFLGHNPYEGLDVSPDATASLPTAAAAAADPIARARVTVHRYAVDAVDEAMLVDLLGLGETEPA